MKNKRKKEALLSYLMMLLVTVTKCSFDNMQTNKVAHITVL
ncbi:MAG: hypothetical protein ACI35O_06935 [Bacillaceae bacterium]